jgi:cell wall-associated NlpC family hydrolase
MPNYDINQIANDWRHTRYQYGGDSHTGIDCSHFVWEVLKAAGHPSAPYTSTSEVPGSHAFTGVAGIPQAGDIILWDGHMGIVLDPTNKIFVGAQSGGVENASYASGSYWGNRRHSFYRYVGP